MERTKEVEAILLLERKTKSIERSLMIIRIVILLHLVSHLVELIRH